MKDNTLFRDLRLKNILAFYEYLETFMLEMDAERLNDSYKKEKLSEAEKITIE